VVTTEVVVGDPTVHARRVDHRLELAESGEARRRPDLLLVQHARGEDGRQPSLDLATLP
jgi:hypothetical protein